MTGRLAIAMPSLRPGGAERTVILLANRLAAEGCLVDLLVTTTEGPLSANLDEGVKLVSLSSSRIVTALVPLIRYLREDRPSTVLSVLSGMNVITLLAVMLSAVRCRVVIAEHSTLSHSSRNARYKRERVFPLLARLLYRRADAIVAVSHGVAIDLARILRIPESDIAIVPNPIISPELLAMSHLEPGHPWMNDSSVPVILAVGRLTRAKDFPTLIRAFALLRQRREARLLILGEGEERPTIEKVINQLDLTDCVSLPGYEPNPYTYMRHSAAFVLSSMWEGLPTVIVEALACGAPVISTDCPSGPREILQDGRLGVLVPVGEPQSLADAMEAVLSEERQHDPLITQVYTADAAAVQYRNLLRV